MPEQVSSHARPQVIAATLGALGRSSHDDDRGGVEGDFGLGQPTRCTMPTAARILSGLPTSGPLAVPFPAEWGRLAREGLVVEFETEVDAWTGNFRPGLGGIRFVAPHPNKRDIVVIAKGDLWIVDPMKHTAARALPAIDAAFEVHDPEGWVFSRQSLAFARLGPAGLLWHTRRLSWDGFDQINVTQRELSGMAWSPVDDKWHPFRVDLRTGKSIGGSYYERDVEGWETCASETP